MATEVRWRRGTALQHANFAGALSEITHETTNNELRLHDGATLGGHPVLMGREKGVPGGVATLDSSGNVPLSQLGNAPHSFDYASASEVGASIVPLALTYLRTAGYSVEGDGGSALYRRVTVEPAHAGKIESSDGAWWEYVPEDVVNVRCFGAKGDNATDDTVALQAAIDTCGYFGGGRVLMPEGNYRTSESIKIRNDNIELIGANEYATTIRPIAAGQDVFVVASSTPGTVEIKGIKLRNFAVVTQAAVNKVILVRNHYQCTIEKVSIWGANSVGIDVENGATAYMITMRDVLVENSTGSSIRLGDQGTGDLQNVLMYNCFLSGGGVGDGLTIRNVGGLHWVGGESLNKDTAIRIAPNVSGRRATGVYISHVFFDTPQNNVLDSGLVAGTRAHEIQFSNCSFNNSVTGAGAVISGNAADNSLLQNWTFVNCSFVINHASGAFIQYCRGIDFIGCKMVSNGVTSGQGYDIQPSASRIKIIGGKSGDGNGFPAHQQAGVWINSGATDIVVQGVDLNGNTSPIVDQGGVRVKVKDCPGFVSFSRGTSSIAASGTSVTVNHGLSVTPTTGDIVIRSVSDTQGPRVWVSAVSSTTFTVTASSAMTAQWFFGWSAGVLGN